MKMTFQPKKRQRSKVHGIRYLHGPQKICGLFFIRGNVR